MIFVQTTSTRRGLNKMNALSILTAKIVSFRSDRRAVTALEYGLIASLVALAIVAGITLLGTNLGLEFTNIAGRV